MKLIVKCFGEEYAGIPGMCPKVHHGNTLWLVGVPTTLIDRYMYIYTMRAS